MNEERPKDASSAKPIGLQTLEKLETLAKSVSLVAIPVVVAIMGNQLNHTISTQEANTKYVELALQILAKKPLDITASEQERSSDQNLRSWAVDLLGATSPVKMSAETKAGLIDGSSTLSGEPSRYYAKIIPSDRIRSSQIGICKGSSIPVAPKKNIIVVPGTNLSRPIPIIGNYSEVIQVDCGVTDRRYNTVQLDPSGASQILRHSPSDVVTIFYDD